jgi:hypothetical protein
MLKMILDSKKPRCVVTGTPGIGKTAFRYYILWLWLLNDKSLSHFKSVIFDFDEYCYLASRSKSGVLSCYMLSDPRQWALLGRSSISKILGLLEPRETDKKRQSTREMKLSIWTASPGTTDADLHELCKMEDTKKFVLMEWSKNEIIKAFGAGVPNDKYGGIPRLLQITETEADEKLADAVDRIGTAFRGVQLDNSSRLAHRLLLLNEKGKPQDFISPWVAKQVYLKHSETIWAQSKNLATTLNQLGWAGSMVGNFFEPMYHDNILENGSITIKKMNVPLNSYLPVTVSAKTTPPVDLNILYLPACRVNDTFDSYVLHQVAKKTYLILLQATVGISHSGGKFSGAVKKVYDEAVKMHTTVEIWMVYALPKGHKASFMKKDMHFTTKKLQKTVKLSYDVVEASFDFDFKF